MRSKALELNPQSSRSRRHPQAPRRRAALGGTRAAIARELGDSAAVAVTTNVVGRDREDQRPHLRGNAARAAADHAGQARDRDREAGLEAADRDGQRDRAASSPTSSSISSPIRTRSRTSSGDRRTRCRRSAWLVVPKVEASRHRSTASSATGQARRAASRARTRSSCSSPAKIRGGAACRISAGRRSASRRRSSIARDARASDSLGLYVLGGGAARSSRPGSSPRWSRATPLRSARHRPHRKRARYLATLGYRRHRPVRTRARSRRRARSSIAVRDGLGHRVRRRPRLRRRRRLLPLQGRARAHDVRRRLHRSRHMAARSSRRSSRGEVARRRSRSRPSARARCSTTIRPTTRARPTPTASARKARTADMTTHAASDDSTPEWMPMKRVDRSPASQQHRVRRRHGAAQRHLGARRRHGRRVHRMRRRCDGGVLQSRRARRSRFAGRWSAASSSSARAAYIRSIADGTTGAAAEARRSSRRCQRSAWSRRFSDNDDQPSRFTLGLGVLEHVRRSAQLRRRPAMPALDATSDIVYRGDGGAALHVSDRLRSARRAARPRHLLTSTSTQQPFDANLSASGVGVGHVARRAVQAHR